MRLPIAKEGVAYSLLLAFLTVLFLFILPVVAIVTGLLFLFCLYFFRDPKERTEPKPGEILSPAYGTVVQIIDDLNPADQNPAKKVGIFLSVFDVHMNYSPMNGMVTHLEYKKGKFCNAMNPQAADINENNSVGIQGKEGQVLVKQIAGLIARRIVCPIKKGVELLAGQKIGLIQFGSRVDIWLPKDIALHIRKGDRVKGGVTILGRVQ